MRFVLTLLITCFIFTVRAQTINSPFSANWQFRNTKESKWYKATIPGTVHTDLLANKLIPDPFYRDNESKVQWIEKESWEYHAVFIPDASLLGKSHIQLVFDGLDTYAKVLLNGHVVCVADNMFRQWTADVKKWLKKGPNDLNIIFSSAVKHDDSIALKSPVKLAGENNRMYSRKAQYQYGWDWGPRLVTCGIWKPIHWRTWNDVLAPEEKTSVTSWNIKLVDQPDASGRAFYFTENGKPVYIKGANWIPCESFLPRAKKLGLYERLIREAKEANINMLRVWGGGVYEDDLFYDLCDQYHILVWQDFMFAGALYPSDDHFLENVKQEITYQVKRLRVHPCIAVWCGNNEIDEAWHNWGWQAQFGYSANDSTRLWNDYKHLFQEIIPQVLNELDPSRPYWSSSPSIGWGRDEAYKQGDVHYWGVWWGKEAVEKYGDHIGRFNSEYGMQAFPPMETIRTFTLPADLDTASRVMKTHQKHPFGYANIKTYIENKFRTPKNFEDLVYVSQLMQADAIKTAIEFHRGSMPYNMGTMFWQWNDCWPVVSWSAVDYYGRKKALFYQVKRSYADRLLTVSKKDTVLQLKYITASTSAQRLIIIGNYYDRSGKNLKAFGQITNTVPGEMLKSNFTVNDSRIAYAHFTIKEGASESEAYYYLVPIKELVLQKPKITWRLIGNTLELSTNDFAYGVQVNLPEGIEPDDNFFELMPGRPKRITLNGKFDPAVLQKQVTVRSLADTY